MNLSPELLLSRLPAFGVSPGHAAVWVAFSGGLDSRVLLQLAVEAGLNVNGRLKAVHIHHGLCAEADGWAAHCRSVCAGLEVELEVHRVTVGAGGSLEDQARRARYRVFEALLQDGDVLLQGHHADDQAETLLLRLLRGSGVRGLASIPECRPLGDGQLLRPLLGCRREQLRCYAEQHGWEWIEDPSNADSVHDRNYLRTQVLPPLSQRWPEAVRSLNRSVGYCADALRLSEDLARIDLISCRQADGGLSIDAVAGLADYRRSNLLRYWIHSNAGVLVNEMTLLKLWHEVANACDDAQPQLRLVTVDVRRFERALYLVAETPPATAQVWRWSVAYDHGSQLALPGGLLRAVPAIGEGLALPASGQLQVALRQGGERIRLPGRAGSRSLKKLLQQSRVPPWRRQQLPLIYAGKQLLAVADLWVADGCQAGAGQAGLRLSWQPSEPLLPVPAEGEF